MKRLNELGARKFVIADVGPLGCIPYVRALEFIPAGECSAAANKLCEGYNKRLKRMINKLNQEMGPKSVFVYTNTHDIVMGIIRRHGQYGTLHFAAQKLAGKNWYSSSQSSAFCKLMKCWISYAACQVSIMRWTLAAAAASLRSSASAWPTRAPPCARTAQSTSSGTRSTRPRPSTSSSPVKSSTATPSLLGPSTSGRCSSISYR